MTPPVERRAKVRRPPWQAYTLAVALPIVVLLLRMELYPVVGNPPSLILFVIPVTLCAYFGGLLPGLLSTAFSAVLAAYFLMAPHSSFSIASPLATFQWVTFIAAGSVISLIVHKLIQSQQRLAQDKLLLSSILNSAMDGIITVDKDLNLLYMNPAAEKMFGHQAITLLGQSARILVPQAKRDACVKMVRAFAAGDAAHLLATWPVTGLRADGEEFPVEVALSRVDTHNGMQFNLVLRDISARVKAETQLRESETLYRALFETLEEGVVVWDTTGCIEACNPAAERIMGRSAQDLIGRHYTNMPWRLMGPDEQTYDPAQGAVATILRTGQPLLHRERWLTRPDGSEIWTLQHGLPLPRAAPDAQSRIIITFTDITERRRALQDLTRMAAIVEHSDDAIISTALDGIVRTWNPGAEKMLGYAPEAIIGQSMQKLVTADMTAATQEILARIARGKTVNLLDSIVLRQDQYPLQVSISLSPIRDAQDAVIGVSAIVRDITKSKLAEEALRARDAAEEASRLKSEFLATMSHELRTPLTGIIGFTEYLVARHAGAINADQADCLDSVLSSSLHLLDVINGILDLSKIEAGHMDVSIDTFSPRDVVNEVCTAISPLALKKSIRLNWQVANAIDTVKLDRSKFRQVLYNLLANAVKFTDDGGRVTADVEQADAASLMLRVTDNGIGIHPDDIGKLFHNFQQLDSSNTRRHEGTGLGLALTKKIVELQNGRISVESTPGTGSVFTVTLPLPQ